MSQALLPAHIAVRRGLRTPQAGPPLQHSNRERINQAGGHTGPPLHITYHVPVAETREPSTLQKAGIHAIQKAAIKSPLTG